MSIIVTVDLADAVFDGTEAGWRGGAAAGGVGSEEE
jgi:hypothetical protein